jgi:hypothetical protein
MGKVSDGFFNFFVWAAAGFLTPEAYCRINPGLIPAYFANLLMLIKLNSSNKA